MDFLQKVTVLDIEEVTIIPVPRGRMVEMTARRCDGITFCMGEGQILYRQGKETYLSDQNHAVFLPAGATYTLECREGGQFPLVNFRASSPVGTAFCSLPLRNPEQYLYSFDALKDCFLFHRRRAGALAVLYEILASLSDEVPPHGSDMLAPALRYLEAHYNDPDLHNARLAAEINVSEVYFRRLFARTLHTTPRQYLLDLRLKSARALLRADSRIGIGAVAEACGFSGIYHFSRAFSRAVGCSPSEYRNRFRTRPI